jgi:hypothetical protein
MNCRFCGRFTAQSSRTGQSGMRPGIYSCSSRERKSLMLTCLLFRKKRTVSGHHLGENCAEFGIVREVVRHTPHSCSIITAAATCFDELLLDTEMYAQSSESANACAVKNIRARLPSQARRAALASETRTCMGPFRLGPHQIMTQIVTSSLQSLLYGSAGNMPSRRRPQQTDANFNTEFHAALTCSDKVQKVKRCPRA